MSTIGVQQPADQLHWSDVERLEPRSDSPWSKQLDPAEKAHSEPSNVDSDDLMLGQMNAALTSEVPDGFEPPSRSPQRKGDWGQH
jgi:hypothetical protein